MAGIILESEVKQVHIAKVKDTLRIFSDGYIEIKLNHGIRVSFQFEGQRDGEGDVAFGERFQKAYWLACLRIRAKLNKANMVRDLTEAISVEEEVVDDDTIT